MATPTWHAVLDHMPSEVVLGSDCDTTKARVVVEGEQVPELVEVVSAAVAAAGYRLVPRRSTGRRRGRQGFDDPEVIERMIRGRVRLGLSWAQIAAKLDELGVPTAQGAEHWSGATVRRIVERALAERAKPAGP